MKSLARIAALAAAWTLSCGAPSQPAEFRGTLDAELVAAEEPSFYERLRPAAKPTALRRELGLAAGAQVFAGRWRIAPAVDQDVVLVEEGQTRFVATDADGDGTIGPEERYALEPLTDNEYFQAEATLPIAASHERYSVFPIKVRLPKGATVPGNGSMRFLWRSAMVSLYGTADLDGTPVRLRYDGFHPRSGRLDPARNGLGVDGNGDGEIVADPRSPEWAYPRDEEVIFRVGDRYLSTRTLDLDGGTVVLASHDASGYVRIELTPGGTIPDFDFVDFEGRQRSLSEFRGRPLLLDFWGAWCGPCIREIPHLKEAYERFRPKGLEILGLDSDPARPDPSPEQLAKGLEMARGVVEEHGLHWPQARTDSILDLIHQRFRISSYPTMVLLDAGGKIVSAGGRGHLPLRGPELIQTLEKLYGE